MSADQERALRLGMDRIRREMLAGQDDALARVEVKRRLELDGHPGDAEPGHREDCGRLAAEEVSRYFASLDAADQLAASIARVVTDHVREIEAWDRPIEIDGPGLEPW